MNVFLFNIDKHTFTYNYTKMVFKLVIFFKNTTLFID